MAKLGEAVDKIIKSRAVRWTGYLAWAVILLSLLSFAWGNMVENQPWAAFVGGVVLVVIFELGIGVRLIAKYLAKEKRERAVQKSEEQLL